MTDTPRPSAIERDREVAAKATSIRAWFEADHDGTGEMVVNIYDRERWLGGEIPVPVLIATARAKDAEHIVRLHNRQPLYGALEKAVARWIETHYVVGFSAKNVVDKELEDAWLALDQEPDRG